MSYKLNDRAVRLAERLADSIEEWRAKMHLLTEGGCVFDLGIDAQGSLAAGLAITRIAMAGMGDVSLVPGQIGSAGWPHVFVTTDEPTAACLLSQYAGWEISDGEYFAMGSGPMRAAAAREELFHQLDYAEKPERCVGVLETAQLPDAAVLELLARDLGTEPASIVLLVARTASLAGTLQIVGRSVETALHKLFELGFDVTRIKSACGTAPLAPVAGDDLSAIGRTNDAILYGGRVMLWVRGDDDSLVDMGPRVPAASSESYGRPFLEIFEEADRDFYGIDPLLFSPAEVVFQNLDSGRVHRFGGPAPEVLQKSFGLEG